MSKFVCHCGNVISTVEYPNSVEGWLYGVEGEEEFETKIEDAVVAYFDAKKKEEKRQWLAAFFAPDYPQDLSDSSVIADLITKIKRPFLREVLECPVCGRLHVQEEPGENVYRSYEPSGAKPGILKNRPNKRPDGTSAKAPSSKPSQRAAVPHP